MKTIKTMTLGMVLGLLALTSCYDDKGNYTYAEVPEITVENLPASITVVGAVDPIVLEPTFTSSTEGQIDDNPNFQFGCRLYKNSGNFDNNERFIDINEEGNKDVYYVPNIDEGDYTCWYTVTDRRTDVVASFRVPVKVTSSTYEGWMVLCDEGAGQRVRMDFVSVLSKDRIVPVYDILGSDMPEVAHASSVFYDAWPKYAHGDYIWLTSQDGTYSVNANSLKVSANSNIVDLDFIVTPEDEQVVAIDGIYQNAHFVVTDKGNLYKKITWKAGTAFEDPINTLAVGTKPQFAVAPFIGVVMRRPLDMYQKDIVALFYDKDNKRFIKWTGTVEEGNACVALEDPSGALFSFTTNKDIIAMKNTTFSEGVVYSVLEDADSRYVYGINIAGGAFSQSYYQKMDIEGFRQATQFAFHSQYPYMFYNNDDKVYCYHLMNRTLSQPLTLDGEEITLVKFNLFQRRIDDLADQSEEFLEQQHYLIVGSYKKNANDDNGGILRFYKFDQTTGSLIKKAEYTGFAKIRDVVYRER